MNLLACYALDEGTPRGLLAARPEEAAIGDPLTLFAGQCDIPPDEGGVVGELECDECDGRGMNECPECGQESDCDNCAGRGWVREPDKGKGPTHAVYRLRDIPEASAAIVLGVPDPAVRAYWAAPYREEDPLVEWRAAD